MRPRHNRLIKNIQFCILDVETTGGGDSRICEIALVWDREGEPREAMALLVDPQCPIPPELTQKIHGISNRMVRSCRCFSEVTPMVEEWLDGVVVVAHNAEFDKGVLQAEFVRAGKVLPAQDWVCTLRLARRLGIPTGQRNLVELAQTLGLRARRHHRALADALLCHFVFSQFLPQLEVRGVKTLGQLLEVGGV